MSFVVIIGILTLIASLFGIAHYARRHRPLAFSYSALACYSLGLLLLWSSYAYGPAEGPGYSHTGIWIVTGNDARYNLLLELSWLAIVLTGVLLLFALREYTLRRFAKAIADREAVDRLDTLPTIPRRRKKRRRRRSRRNTKVDAETESEPDAEAEEEE